MTASEWNEEFQERAAIMQFCGNLPRATAEHLALADVTERRGPKPGPQPKDVSR